MCLYRAGERLCSAQDHDFLAFQPDNSLPKMIGAPVFETLHLSEEAFESSTIPDLFGMKGIPNILLISVHWANCTLPDSLLFSICYHAFTNHDFVSACP